MAPAPAALLPLRQGFAGVWRRLMDKTVHRPFFFFFRKGSVTTEVDQQKPTRQGQGQERQRCKKDRE